MIGLAQKGPKVLISENKIPTLIPKEELQTANETMRTLLGTDVYVAISKYSDSFMIIVNQTGTMGSLYKGKYTGEVLPDIDEEDFDVMEENAQSVDLKPEKIYDTKCLFGSTQIEFYELLMRKILQVLFEQNKTDPTISVLMNVSLPVKWKLWSEYEHKYYQAIIGQIRTSLKEVI